MVCSLSILVQDDADAEEKSYMGTGMGLSNPTIQFISPTGKENYDAKYPFIWEILHLGHDYTEHFGANINWGYAWGSGENDSDWSIHYLVPSIRITGNKSRQEFYPYSEFGVGGYLFSYKSDAAAARGDDSMQTDFDPGLRIAQGFYKVYKGVDFFKFDEIYVGTEFSYQFVKFDDSGDFLGTDIRFSNWMFLIKVGWFSTKSADE